MSRNEGHGALDELKRNIALEVVRYFDASRIRAQILANLIRRSRRAISTAATSRPGATSPPRISGAI